jgi:hypothetical protein
VACAGRPWCGREADEMLSLRVRIVRACLRACVCACVQMDAHGHLGPAAGKCRAAWTCVWAE